MDALQKNVEALYEGLQKIPNLKVKDLASLAYFFIWFAPVKSSSQATVHELIMKWLRFFFPLTVKLQGDECQDIADHTFRSGSQTEFVKVREGWIRQNK